MSVNGTKRTYQLVQRTSAIEGKADIPPDLWLGRPPPCSAQPLILIFRAPNQAMEGTPLSPVTCHRAAPTWCAIWRGDRHKHLPQSFHLIEHPIGGIGFAGPWPVSATCFIASKRSRRALGTGVVRDASSRPRYCSSSCPLKPKKSGVHWAS